MTGMEQQQPMSLASFERHHEDRSERELQLRTLHQIYRIERIMSELSDALATQQGVLDQIVTLIQNFAAGPTQAQLDAANQALADLQVVDDADKAALQAALDEIAAASADVTGDTATLQALLPPVPPSA